MKRTSYTPRVPDPATDAMVKTMAASAFAGQEEIAQRLAEQQAEQQARDAEIATRMATLADLAAQIDPLRESAQAEHGRLQAAIDELGEKLATASASASEAVQVAAAAATAAKDEAAAASLRAQQVEADLAALSARVAAMEERTVAVRRATLQLPTLALGATYEQHVTWSTPMPSATYSVEVLPNAGLLGKATVRVKSGSQTTVGLTVQVTASLFVAGGSSLDITATHFG